MHFQVSGDVNNFIVVISETNMPTAGGQKNRKR
jgi:hypothetical protein